MVVIKRWFKNNWVPLAGLGLIFLSEYCRMPTIWLLLVTFVLLSGRLYYLRKQPETTDTVLELLFLIVFDLIILGMLMVMGFEWLIPNWSFY